MEALFLAALLGLLPAFIASSKGRSFGLWWFYGAMIFIVAIVHAIVLKDKSVTVQQYRSSSAPPSRERRLTGTHGSVADEIGKLAALRDQGAISEEEFAAQKRRLIG
jgi:uncharacterized membrane protein